MPNRRQYVPQTAAVLLACGLIASLLPGLSAAQDGPDKRPVKRTPDFATSGQISIPGGESLPDMPMKAPPENSLAYEVSQKPAIESKDAGS